MTTPTPPSASSSGSTSRSRAARRLTHRQPQPRSFGERVWRFLGRVAKPFTKLVSVSSVLMISAWFVQHLYYSDQFRLEGLVIEGATRTSEARLRDHLLFEGGIEPGVSMLSFTPESVERLCEALPVVAEARAIKRWPRGLTVEVTERVPRGIFVSATGSYVFDDEGVLFAAAGIDDFRNLDGPMLSGWSNHKLEVGDRLPRASLARVREELALMERASRDLYAGLAEVHWQEESGLKLIFGDGVTVRVGHQSLATAGPIIETVLESSTPAGLQLASVVVSGSEAVAVTRVLNPVEQRPIIAARDR